VLVKAPTVREYEIRQSEQGLDASVVADGYYGELGAALESALRDAGLEDPQVRVRSVDCIWPHPATGKVRRFIPL
jgi:phenylacetate-CoA ligase